MNQKGWTLMELLVTIFIVFSLITFIWSLSSVIKGCSNTADMIEKHGLKSVIERVWEGDRSDR